jgi:hypothetical protein
MITKLINSLTNPAGRPDAVQQGADEERKSRKETKLIDVAEEYMRLDRRGLDGLVRMGRPRFEREQFKGKVKKRVWDLIDENLGTVDCGMVEEITERMVDAAEADPFYRKMFDEEEGRE